MKNSEKSSASTHWKTLKVFVSSTFRDLELARDRLNQVFRGIESELLERQLALRPYDLRWRDRHSSDPIVDWCVKMVENCQYFIGILGHRYGWRPALGPAAQENCDHISITEMEINTALQNIAPERRFFCFGDFSPAHDEGEEDVASMENLKNRLRDNGELIYECRNIEDLLITVGREFRRIIDADYPSNHKMAPLQYSYREALCEIIAEKRRDFIGRVAYLQKIQEFACGSHMDNYLVIHADAGTGKSALLAEFIHRWHGQKPVVSHFMSMGGDSREINGVMESIGRQLQDLGILSDPLASDAVELRGQVRNALQSTKNPIIVAIDGLDEMDERYRNLAWLPQVLPANIRIILTTRPVETWEILQNHPRLVSMNLSPLEYGEIREIIAGYNRRHRLDLLPGDRELLQSRARGNPLFLKVALDEILSSGMAVAQLAITIESLFEQVLQRLEKKYGRALVDEYLGLIAAGKKGILEKELADMLKVGDEVLLSLAKSLNNFIVTRHGLLDFFHPEFKRTVMMRFGKAKMRVFHHSLAHYFSHKGYVYTRSLEELPYQLQTSEHHSRLMKTLTDLHFLETKCTAGLVNDLSQDFEFALNDPATRIPADISCRMDNQVMVTRETLVLLGRAIAMDLQFIRRYPNSLFQSLWNRCYWYDCPQAHHHYKVYDNAPWLKQGVKLYSLMEHWRIVKEKNSDFAWLKSLRPLSIRPDSALIKTFRGHDKSVNCVAVNPDGSQVISGARDNTAYLWQTASGEILHRLCGHKDKITAVDFSSNGQNVLTASFDKTIRIWDVKSGEMVKMIETGNKLWSAKFNHDGLSIISGGQDKILRIWEVKSGNLLQMLSGHEQSVWSVAISHDGSKVASGSHDKTVRIWDIASGKLLHILPHEERVTCVAFDHDGRKLATGAWDNHLHIWDVETGEKRQKLSGHEQRICSVAFASTGNRLVSGSYDRTSRIWDTDSGTSLYTFSGHGGAVYAVAFSPDNTTIVSGSYDKTVRIWEVIGNHFFGELKGHGAWVRSIEFGSNETIVSAGQDKALHLWNDRGELLRTLAGHDSTVSNASFSPDGKKIVSCSCDRTVRIWDADQGSLLHILRGHENSVSSASFSPDGSKIVSAGEDNTVRIWEVASGTLLHILSGHEQLVQNAAFNHCGDKIVSCSHDQTVRLWHAETGNLLQVFNGHESAVCSVAFSPDDRLLVSGSYDTTVRIWEVSGNQLQILRGHKDIVYHVRFNYDGQQVISESRDKTIRTWEPEGGRCVKIIHGQGDINGKNFESACFSAYVLARNEETIVEDKYGKTIAVFPGKIGGVKLARKNLIIGYGGDYVYVLRLC